MSFGEGHPGVGGKGVIGSQATQGVNGMFQEASGVASTLSPFKGLIGAANLSKMFDPASVSLTQSMQLPAPTGISSDRAIVNLFGKGGVNVKS